MALWRWVESVQCWCLWGAALQLCGWGGLSLGWALGSRWADLPEEPAAPCASVTGVGGVLQALVTEASSAVQRLAVLGLQEWRSMCCAAPCALLLLGPEGPLRQRALHVLLRSLPGLWRTAEQSRLSETQPCLHGGCAAWHRERRGQGRMGSSNALPPCCCQHSLLGLGLSSTVLTKSLLLLTTPSGSSSYLCPTCSSQRESF